MEVRHVQEFPVTGPDDGNTPILVLQLSVCALHRTTVRYEVW